MKCTRALSKKQFEMITPGEGLSSSREELPLPTKEQFSNKTSFELLTDANTESDEIVTLEITTAALVEINNPTWQFTIDIPERSTAEEMLIPNGSSLVHKISVVLEESNATILVVSCLSMENADCSGPE